MLALQFIQMIDMIWKSNELDLRFERRKTHREKNRNVLRCFSLLPYGCLATGLCSGFIEVVKNAKTIMNIQKLGGLKSAFQLEPTVLYRWIAKNNPGPEKYFLTSSILFAQTEFLCRLKSAIDLFTRSCAGYCVLTYVLGVADRHPDNIMVHERGQVDP